MNHSNAVKPGPGHGTQGTGMWKASRGVGHQASLRWDPLRDGAEVLHEAERDIQVPAGRAYVANDVPVLLEGGVAVAALVVYQLHACHHARQRIHALAQLL